MRQWTVKEWERLPLGNAPGKIPEPSAAVLTRAAEKSDVIRKRGIAVLDFGRDSLRARNVVGAISTDSASLEILPKIEVDSNTNDQGENARSRAQLIRMLAVAYDIEISAGELSMLGRQNETVLEILIRLFCDKLIRLAQRGLPKRYLSRRDDISALRGRLQIVRQFTVLAATPQRLACQFDELSEDIALNQIIKAAICAMRKHAPGIETRRILSELAFFYADVSEITVAQLPWEQATIDRTNASWLEVLTLARLFLQGQYQTTSFGRESGFSLLFDMNTLFESYVAKIAIRAARGTTLRVHVQGGRKYCLTENGEGERSQLFQTKPNILIMKAGECRMIIDTKWKHLAPLIEDQKQGVSQGDVYQMMAYGQLYDCPHCVLLYPHHDALQAHDGIQRSFRVTDRNETISVATIDIRNANNVATVLRALICKESDNSQSAA